MTDKRTEQATAPNRSPSPDAESHAETTISEQVIDAVAAVFEWTDESDSGPTRLDKMAYRMFGESIRKRKTRFEDYRQTINAARLEKTYDQYIAKSILLTLIVGMVGAFIGLSIGLFLSYFNVFGSIQSSVALPSSISALLTDTVKNALGAVAITLTFGLLFGSITAIGLYLHPYNRAYQRSREIGSLLPQTVTYMYALTQGGMLLVDTFERLADEGDTYGEMAVEFQAIRNDMLFFGADLKSALRDTRDATPNDEFAELLDDLISIIDSGGNPTPFLEDKTEEYQRKSKRQEESFLETLDLVAQVYVTIGVVGVLLSLTIFIIMASIGGSGNLPIYATVYVGIPMLGVLFLVILDSITTENLGIASKLPTTSEPPTAAEVKTRLESTETATTDGGTPTPSNPPSRTTRAARLVRSRTDGHEQPLSAQEQNQLGQLHNALRRERVLETIGAPVRMMRKHPLTSMAFTLPAALLYMAVMAFTGLVTYSAESLTATPVWTTTIGFVLPALGILTPISYYHERRFRYQRQVNNELADVLKKLSSASGTGAGLSDNISMVATSSTGILASELRRVKNELQWNVSMNDALTRFANRVENPRLTRVVKLLIEANTASGQVGDVLNVAAKDAQNAKELDDRRFASMTTNMVIIVFGYVIFLAISAILIVELFPPLAEAAAQSAGTDADAPEGVGGGWEFNIDEYRMLFFHGILMQAVVSGLIAGKFGYNSAASGIKFSIGGILLAVVVFLLI